MKNRPQRTVRIGAADGGWRGNFTAMGSPCEVLVETDRRALANDLASVAAAEAWRVEDKFSRYLEGNIVSRINSAQGQLVELDDETARVVDFAVTLYELSDKRFDITSGVLRRAWTFDGSERIPEQGDVDAVMRLVGWDRVTWATPKLTMPANMEIDFGGIGKEYAVDKVAGVLRERTSCSCLVNFGGDLAVTVPPQNRPHWLVGIEGVDARGNVAEVLVQLRSGALATSGDARRFLLKDGVRYSHILDPTTGWPVPDAPRSITVAAETCVQAGMMSTLAMLKGREAEGFLKAQELKYWCYRE